MRLWLESVERNQLKNLQVCEIHIEKSTIAKELEKELGISWSFDVYNHKEPYYHLRACIKEPVTLEPEEIFPFPTGIYPQLINPNFVLEVNGLSGLIYNHCVVMAERVTYFPYTFRNEIWINLENKNNDPVIIQPAQKIAQMTAKQLPRMVIKYVDQIEESPWKTDSGKTFIKHLKVHIKKPGKKQKETDSYSREKIERIYGKHYER